MTSTANIAGFSRITLPLVTRIWPTDVAEMIEDGKKRKKGYRVPQLDEEISSDRDETLRREFRCLTRCRFPNCRCKDSPCGT